MTNSLEIGIFLESKSWTVLINRYIWLKKFDTKGRLAAPSDDAKRISKFEIFSS